MQSPQSGPNRATQPTRRDIMIGGALATATLASLLDVSPAAQPDSGQGPSDNAIEGVPDMSMVTTEDGTQIFYKDWGKVSPSCSATAGRFRPTIGMRKCYSSSAMDTASLRMIAGATGGRRRRATVMTWIIMPTTSRR